MLLDAERARDDAAETDPAFRDDVLAGLRMRPRAIPARWLYDRAGSELFEAITELPEYYPTRTETALLAAHCAEVGEIAGPGRAVVEFGSGSSIKTPHLLGRIAPAAYVPIDISGEYLRASAAVLAADFPKLPVLPVEADFTHPIDPPPSIATLPKLGFFPGSTIGNMVPRTAVNLLRAMVETLGQGAMLLIGMDRLKDERILLPAYDDAQGITARFNLNLAATFRSTPSATWRSGTTIMRGSRCISRRAAPCGSTSTASYSRWRRARRSTPRTATNMVRARRACCCGRGPGRRSANGRTPMACSR